MKVPVRQICDDCYNSTNKDTVTYNKLVKDGRVIGFVEVSICPDCGEEYITNIFSDGDIDLECLAMELGFREDFEDDEFDFDKDFYDEYDDDFEDEEEDDTQIVNVGDLSFIFKDGKFIKCLGK